ncbi:DUF4352 domain-containing protein [Paenarthrobacter sp. AR 02]|uniref:DUF4352 domain-containing protein n=1 Tax=Paenarthrobacter sp. AR 02 TaxID=2899821 RepID=UPI001F1DA485|nr:DUF4352 domain-containing protein [Paenarthrobacter sp. AR 02]MCF3141449.1 DUF4352 domain-containing protein [Paenarthrobacter sp. AR 02]
MALTAARRHVRVLVPLALLILVGSLVAGIVTTGPRKPPAMLGASGTTDGGLGRINGVIPVEADGWTPPTAAAALDKPPVGEMHRVRILVEFTATGSDGITFDPSRYSVSALGAAKWKPVWAAPGPAVVRQGQSIDATLVFELPDRAVDLTLELPGGPGLSLGAGHHRPK